jgi:NADPH-dependent 2,4-dienoyl-CoA reductase/sulfur reductase-like enzyme/nitrite reductase/ring-hydroxylating ferredoxin subunit
VFQRTFGNCKKQPTAPGSGNVVPEEEIVEEVVAKVSEVPVDQMKEFALGDGKVLVVNHKGQLSAVGNKCTHLGAPLVKGAFCEGRIRCPWHGAAFNSATGDIEDFPGLDSLPCYKVRVVNENIVVAAKKSEIKPSKRTKAMVEYNINDKRLFLIIGGGAAGVTCAETLRQVGYKGKILVLSKEKYLPYDRTKLSKGTAFQVDKLLLRPEEFYAQHHIEFKLGVEVIELDPEKKSVILRSGETITYDRCLVATGGVPRTLPVIGMNSKNIFILRDIDDARKVMEGTRDKHVVIVGSSFIGMETASIIVKNCKSVVVLGMEKVPFERVLGTEIGAVLQKFHEKNGIQFKMEAVVAEFKTENDLVTAVVLKNGDVLPCEAVVLGAGIVPATSFVKPTGGIKIHPRDKSIICDQYLQAADGVYAAGDIATFPYFGLNNKEIRVEHWGFAQTQGMIAAMNMMGQNVPLHNVPFFWTTIFGKSVRYSGFALEYDEVIIDKAENGFDPDVVTFVAFYAKDNRVVAACAMNRDPVVSQVAELIHHNKMPSASEIKDCIRRTGSCSRILQEHL